jgi:hypothetical protein
VKGVILSASCITPHPSLPLKGGGGFNELRECFKTNGKCTGRNHTVAFA